MSIVYNPSAMLNKIAPEKKIKKMLKANLIDVKKTSLSFVDDIDFLSKKDVTKTALKVAKNYKKRIKDLGGDEKKELIASLKKDPKLLIQRVQNEVILQIKENIKESYRGEFYIWLPSDASEPEPEHQLLYGQEFQIGNGEMPGDRIGCRCGMEILVKQTQLELD